MNVRIPPLTEEQIKEIQKLFYAGGDNRDNTIAKKLGVRDHQVNHITEKITLGMRARMRKDGKLYD